MSNPNNGMTLAMRREALLAQCALQRVMMAVETRELLAPLAPTGWRQYLGTRMKVPLAIAGVVLGLVVVRPGRAASMVQLGTTLWSIARTVLPMLRRPAMDDSGE